jgi:hypothetical protein
MRAPGRRKQFFFEKKNQKTFVGLVLRRTGRGATLQRIKVFWFFFSKKNRFFKLPL